MTYEIIGQEVASVRCPVLTQHNFADGSIRIQRWPMSFISEVRKYAESMALVALWKPKKINA